MKTNVKVHTTISVDLGSTDGYHGKDTLEEIHEAFGRKALGILRDKLSGSPNVSMAPDIKFTITVSDRE